MRLIDPCTDPDWADLAKRYGRLFHSPEWLRVIRDGYRLQPRAVIAGDSGLAWVDFNDIRGRRSVSLPFSDFGGPIGTDPIASLSEMVEALSSGQRPRRTARTVRVLEPDTAIDTSAGTSTGPANEAGGLLRPAAELAWHWADLRPHDPTEDGLWAALASGARQNVRRSRKSGVTVDVRSDLDAVKTYYRLHHGLRKTKYRLLCQPWSFFDAVHRHFAADDLKVVLARAADDPDREALAGVLLLRHQDWGYYKLNASTPAAWQVRANDAVMWESMLEARRWGCHRFDFGVSDVDQPGLIRYKRKFATGNGRVVVLRDEGDDPGWRARQAGRLLPQATKALTSPRCPDVIGGQASRVLYRLFG